MIVFCFVLVHVACLSLLPLSSFLLSPPLPLPAFLFLACPCKPGLARLRPWLILPPRSGLSASGRAEHALFILIAHMVLIALREHGRGDNMLSSFALVFFVGDTHHASALFHEVARCCFRLFCLFHAWVGGMFLWCTSCWDCGLPFWACFGHGAGVGLRCGLRWPCSEISVSGCSGLCCRALWALTLHTVVPCLGCGLVCPDT